MSVEVTRSESLPRKGRKRKAKAQPDYSSRAETAQLGEVQGGLPVGLPKGGDWVEPSGEALDQGVTTNPVATSPTYVAEGIESPSEAFWLLLLQAGYTCGDHVGSETVCSHP